MGHKFKARTLPRMSDQATYCSYAQKRIAGTLGRNILP